MRDKIVSNPWNAPFIKVIIDKKNYNIGLLIKRMIFISIN